MYANVPIREFFRRAYVLCRVGKIEEMRWWVNVLGIDVSHPTDVSNQSIHSDSTIAYLYLYPLVTPMIKLFYICQPFSRNVPFL